MLDQNITTDMIEGGGGAVIKPESSEELSGLFTTEDTLVASWVDLVTEYEFDCTQDYDQIQSPLADILTIHFDTYDELKLVIPDTVKVIGSYVFNNCTTITEVVLPQELSALHEFAFANCVGLKNVNIPTNLISLEKCVFSGCSHLNNIIIPNNIFRLKYGAFQECIRLSSIYFDGTISDWNTLDKSIGCMLKIPARVVHCANGTVNLKRPSAVYDLSKLDIENNQCVGVKLNEKMYNDSTLVYKDYVNYSQQLAPVSATMDGTVLKMYDKEHLAEKINILINGDHAITLYILLKFTIDGKEYNSPKGWTWEQWVANTRFNTDGYMLYGTHNEYIATSDGRYVIDAAGPTSVINGTAYSLIENPYH